MQVVKTLFENGKEYVVLTVKRLSAKTLCRCSEVRDFKGSGIMVPRNARKNRPHLHLRLVIGG